MVYPSNGVILSVCAWHEERCFRLVCAPALLQANVCHLEWVESRKSGEQRKFYRPANTVPRFEGHGGDDGLEDVDESEGEGKGEGDVGGLLILRSSVFIIVSLITRLVQAIIPIRPVRQHFKLVHHERNICFPVRSHFLSQQRARPRARMACRAFLPCILVSSLILLRGS